MESGNFPIIQSAVPEKIYGGYTPGNIYEPAKGDSGFYDLFARQMNGPASVDGSASAGNDDVRRAEEDMQAEKRARRADSERVAADSRAADEAGSRAQNESVRSQAETDRERDAETAEQVRSGKHDGSAAQEAESGKGSAENAADQNSAKAGAADEETSRDRADGGEEKEKLEALKVLDDKISRAAGEGKKKIGIEDRADADKKYQEKLSLEENVKAAADRAQAEAEAVKTSETGRDALENKEKRKNEAENTKTAVTEEGIVTPGVVELHIAGKEEGVAGEQKTQESNRKVKRESKLFKTGESGKGRVIIEDRRTVKALEKDGASAQWKKDGAGTDKQNLDFRQAVKDELLDKSEKIIRIGNEQLERLQDGKPLPTGRSNGLSHSSELLRQLRESGNRQIVKHTGIILKDNSSGEIKLVLKPENLGDVRIRLQLSENSITGKILVDNQMVRAAFEQNLEALYKAFKESGFDSASLDVQVGGEAGHGKGNKEGGETEYASRQIKFLEEQIPLSNDGNFADTVIDLVV